MPAKIICNSDDSITVSVTFKPGKTMLDCETQVQEALNEAGALATGQCLKRFDSDGAPSLSKPMSAACPKPWPKMSPGPSPI